MKYFSVHSQPTLVGVLFTIANSEQSQGCSYPTYIFTLYVDYEESLYPPWQIKYKFLNVTQIMINSVNLFTTSLVASNLFLDGYNKFITSVLVVIRVKYHKQNTIYSDEYNFICL